MITSKSLLRLQKVCHDLKNTSRQKVSHNVKKLVRNDGQIDKIHYDVNMYIRMSKSVEGTQES